MSAIVPLNMRQSTSFITIAYDKVSANGPTSVSNTSEVQSGHKVVKKSLKNLKLCIFMIYNVIRCIKITQKTQILKIADLTM